MTPASGDHSRARGWFGAPGAGRDLGPSSEERRLRPDVLKWKNVTPTAENQMLVVTAITRDPGLIGRLLSSPNVGRRNLVAIPTCQISWDQPHEGNLFDHLYARRAFQCAV